MNAPSDTGLCFGCRDVGSDASAQTMTSKRGFIGLTLLAVGGACVRPHRLAAADGDKMSKQQSEYQDGPKGIQMCATCTLFVEPHSCKVVEGDISPNGWCNAYAMAD
jgi:hypothetical protein